MLTRRLIPSLLLRGGRLVKGIRFDGHKDAGRPDTTARAHNAQGADEMILLDIDASKEGRGPDVDAIREVAKECFMPLTVGGGIRSVEDARACMDVGADKLALTTTAMENPGLIVELAHVFGSQAVVLGADILRTEDGVGLFDHRTNTCAADTDPVDWVVEAVDRGAGEIRLTAVDREGSREGFDLDLLAMVSKRIDVPVVIEGGGGNLEHLSAVLDSGADGVCVGSMLVFSDNNIVKIKRYLAQKGHEMRFG